ncbi:Mcm16p NDAI_0J00640 [Naumovozyma dairenensis CBS 421]|uniref:Uncharacterized protein n=1 Tax=Naumovozyma dairenensis (strain ATCC 10597 / BCRC 20456 / CBS 421 / NBRC 0211 / NRRL Y-12639) TaxID=1071378 RepID=G0WGM8_NAUDC|nr:hypothetical protein NDAI_0J00640 [Naumovozyma dairenensis CBS 421]CCD26956.1 hypothetical protein NDAI_0J00640 [Naumovozyma dairenensis CBS 421]
MSRELQERREQEEKLEQKGLQEISRLEREHVQIHSQLLSALDEIYLLREGGVAMMNEKVEKESHLLELRKQLQLSLDKSAAILKTFERTNAMSNSGGDREDTEESAGGIINTAVLNDAKMVNDINEQNNKSIENILAKRLRDMMDVNFHQDFQLNELLTKQDEMLQKLYLERRRFHQLKSKLVSVAETRQTLAKDKQEQDKDSYGNEDKDGGEDDDDDDDDEQDVQLGRENLVMDELLMALKVTTGYRRTQ